MLHGKKFENRFADDMDVDRLIGWNFKRLRTAQGVSQGEMSLRLVTLDQGYLSQLEDGQRNPTGRTIFRLASALDVDPGELFSTKGAPLEIVESDQTTVKKSRAGRANPKKKSKH